MSYTECCSEYLFTFASLSPDFKGEIFFKGGKYLLLCPDGGGCWFAMAGNQLYPSTELAAAPTDFLPQKDMAVLRKYTNIDPNMKSLGVSVLPEHCYKGVNEICTE